MPDSLQRIFGVSTHDGLLADYTKSEVEREHKDYSLFTKAAKKTDTKTTSSNLKEQQMNKAE